MGYHALQNADDPVWAAGSRADPQHRLGPRHRFLLSKGRVERMPGASSERGRLSFQTVLAADCEGLDQGRGAMASTEHHRLQAEILSKLADSTHGSERAALSVRAHNIDARSCRQPARWSGFDILPKILQIKKLEPRTRPYGSFGLGFCKTIATNAIVCCFLLILL